VTAPTTSCLAIAAAPTPLHPEGTRRVVAADRLDRDGAYFYSRAF
jgi:hypothetical protein